MRMKWNRSRFTAISQLSVPGSRRLEDAFEFVTSVSYAVKIQRPHEDCGGRLRQTSSSMCRLRAWRAMVFQPALECPRSAGFMHSRPAPLRPHCL